jgi:hypothetical protein
VGLFLLIVGASVTTGKAPLKAISPYEYGFSTAKTDEERFRVLYDTHVAALVAGTNVDYSGIKRIDLEIPKDAKSIPLTKVNDFAGVEFNVKNTQKDFFLFSYTAKATLVKVSKWDIDRGNFKRYPQLKKGRRLLVISDNNPWVLNREGYNYGHVRKDILLLKNGKAVNRTVMPYNNMDSSPSCSFYALSEDGMTVANITLNRSKDSSKKTYMMSVVGVDGLTLNKVSIHTPENQGESDVAIMIKECTNVIFKDVTIDGTYSRSNFSGYGVSLNNIWNFKATNMFGRGNWGVFGTNNVNIASFEDCDINRFDIHCYGRDISFKNVTFRDKYNQFASVFGTIMFDGCNFIHFCPVLNGTSYNSYVGYDIVMKNCTFTARKGKNIIVDCGRLDNVVNARRELLERCLPNISINKLTIFFEDDISNFYLLFIRRKEGEAFTRPFGHISNLIVSGVKFIYLKERVPCNFYTSNIDLVIDTPVKNVLTDIDLIGNSIGHKKYYGYLYNKIQLRSPRSNVLMTKINAENME